MKRQQNDFNLINEMKSVKATQNETNKGDKKRNLNFWINKIIDFLKKKDNYCNIDDLIKEYNNFEVFFKSTPEFLDVIKFSNKVIYDPDKKIFQLKSKYDIKNINQLKEIIQASPYGLVEDEELLESYPGIKNDLELIKKDNFVKIIFNEEKKFNVLFYRDIADRIEQIVIDPHYELALKELRRIWKDEINFFTDEQQTSYTKKKRRHDDKNKKNEKRKKKKQMANTHLLNPPNNQK